MNGIRYPGEKNLHLYPNNEINVVCCVGSVQIQIEIKKV